VLEPPERRGQVFELGDELTVGRAPGCSVHVPGDSFVSQVHARVFSVDGQPWVEDLGSTNGTHLNGTRLESPVPLHRGDHLQVGGTVMEVVA
jgi:pSer/pThr/pTyr-binding forkhead associated (FHA) protein